MTGSQSEGEESSSSEDIPSWILGMIITAIALAVLILMHIVTIDARHPTRSVIVLVPVFVLSLIGVTLLIIAYVRFTLIGYKAPQVFNVLFLALLTMLLALEAFAGTTMLLWGHGLLSSAAPLTPALPTAERYYIWQVANTVPVLDIPTTLGWKSPVMFTDHWSGVLLLTFKLFVLLPLIGLFTASYQFIRMRQADEATGKDKPPTVLGISEAIPIYFSWVQRMAYPALLFAALFLFVRRSSPINRWLSSTFRKTWYILGGKVSFPWVPSVIYVAGLILILASAFIFYILTRQPLNFRLTYTKGSLLTSANAVFNRFRRLLVIMLAACVISLILLNNGAAHAIPTPTSASEAGATVGWYSWHLAEAIPFLHVPESLNWSQQFEFVDPWSRVFLLMLKIDLVLTLFVPVALLIKLHQEDVKLYKEDVGHGD
jgi:hypothetical protein